MSAFYWILKFEHRCMNIVAPNDYKVHYSTVYTDRPPFVSIKYYMRVVFTTVSSSLDYPPCQASMKLPSPVCQAFSLVSFYNETCAERDQWGPKATSVTNYQIAAIDDASYCQTCEAHQHNQFVVASFVIMDFCVIVCLFSVVQLDIEGYSGNDVFILLDCGTSGRFRMSTDRASRFTCILSRMTFGGARYIRYHCVHFSVRGPHLCRQVSKFHGTLCIAHTTT